MDDIARLAGVSKQTIYMHFDDKERLLFAVVMEIMTAASTPFDDDIHLLGDSDDLERDLRQHARGQLFVVLQPRPLQLRRLVIAEAVSFPQLGRSFYELGPGRTINELTGVFRRLDSRGLLRIADAARAASDFNWLIMSEPINRAMLLGDDQPPEPFIDQPVGGSCRAHLSRRLPRRRHSRVISRGRRRDGRRCSRTPSPGRVCRRRLRRSCRTVSPSRCRRRTGPARDRRRRRRPARGG